MKRPILYLMVGYPGSGKTTIAQYLHKITGAEHVWASKERQDRLNESVYDPTESIHLYEILNDEIEKKLKAGRSVIFDTNFRFRRDRDHMRQMAESADADIKLIWVQVPREVAQKRAVEESDGKPTRIWGNMPKDRFKTLADDFDEPDSDENPIVIRGVEASEDSVRSALGLD